jgi:phage terminase small subunit
VQATQDRPSPQSSGRSPEPSTSSPGGNEPPVNLPRVDFHPEGDDEGYDVNGMKPRWVAFVIAYCGEAGGNAQRAAAMAGYNDSNNSSLRTTASRLLTNANIQRAIARRMAEKFGTAEDVKNGIAEIARGNAADYMDWNESGQLQISLEKLAASGQMGLIQEIREKGIDAGGGSIVLIERKLKLYDKLRALELLAKINGQLRDTVHHTGEAVVKHMFYDPKTGEGVAMSDLTRPDAEGSDDEPDAEPDDTRPYFLVGDVRWPIREPAEPGKCVVAGCDNPPGPGGAYPDGMCTGHADTWVEYNPIDGGTDEADEHNEQPPPG